MVSWLSGSVQGRPLQRELQFVLNTAVCPVHAFQLLEDGIHYLRCEQNFPVRNRRRRIVANRSIEALDEISHSGIQVKVTRQEQTSVVDEISQILANCLSRRNKLIGIALVSAP